ncbi:transcriptional regulator [Pseudomonas monteilii]|uniref:transcriptional regulator n=1 Tax=Pseudomonas monteilii TaxID=76759 RepID=UPI0037F25E42
MEIFHLRKVIVANGENLTDEATLNELRRQLGIEDGSVGEAKLNDMPISTLRKHLEVLGASLELVVRFPEEMKITLSGFD